MRLFMVIIDGDIDKIIWVSAKHEGLALWEASKIIGMDKFEMMELGYQAIPVPISTRNGYEIKIKKAKITVVS